MLHLARSRVGQKVVEKSYSCACRFSSTQASTRASTPQPPQDFETVEQMLRPAPRKGDSALWAHHNKNFRTSRFPTYDLDFTFKNNNAEVAGDGVPGRYGNSWSYRLTIMRGNAKSREDIGKKLIATAHELIKKGTPPNVKWLDKALYQTGTAEQVEELYGLAEELGVVDNKLTSTYIYSLAARAGFEQAIKKYEDVKKAGKADTDTHVSGISAYARAMQGDKALQIYDQLQKELGAKVPALAHSNVMTYYFDFGEMRKGFELYNNLEKNGGIIDTKVLTSLIRGHRLAGNLKAAQEAFDNIAKRELRQDINAHCELVMAYARPGNNIGEMMAKLQQMKNEGHRPPHTLYNFVIGSMLAKGEYNNALMALDMQFKEKSYPLDKNLVIGLARHFSKVEKGMRIKEKTEYTIWVGRKAGLYTDDLFYLTTPHSDFMDEYYFRHHPEYDFPNEIRKPYQFKEFDEYPMFREEKINPFERRSHARLAAQAPPQDSRPWNAELPSFSQDYTIITMKPPTFENWAEEKNSEEILAEYDAKADAVWAEMTGRFEAIVEEGRAERRQIAELEARVERRRREVEEYRKAKEEAEKKAQESSAAGVNAEKEAQTEGEKVKENAEAKDGEKGEAKEGDKVGAKEEEKVEAKEGEKVEAKEGAAEKEKEKEVKATEDGKKEGSEVKSTEATEAKPTEGQEGKAAEEELKQKEAAEAKEKEAKEKEEREQKHKENTEAIVRESPQLQEMKDAQQKTKLDRKERLKQLLDIAKQFKKYDDVIPAQERMDPALRAELVQQKRLAHVKRLLTGFGRSPAFIVPQQFDTRRLRVLAVACDDALEALRAEIDLRKPIDTELRKRHVETYKSQVLDLLGRKKYEVAHPLDFKPMPDLRKYLDDKLQETDKTPEIVPAESEDPYAEMTLEARLNMGLISDIQTLVKLSKVRDDGDDETDALGLKLPEDQEEDEELEKPKKKRGLFSDVSELLRK
eukprot:Phypoly_transcript_02043.p1 GENE.Phypoly_transcript_02043~~Phypoly_transcript_02043.p1  ORF type:complete len:974 (+),score=290.99 Phypoly_transcript_02043:64-2985(+)